MNKQSLKILSKIRKNIIEEGFFSESDFKKFSTLTKEEIIEGLQELINKEKEMTIKYKLFKLLETAKFIHDKRLFFLSICSCLRTKSEVKIEKKI